MNNTTTKLQLVDLTSRTFRAKRMGSRSNKHTNLIEHYVLGQLSAIQRCEVEALAANNGKVRAALNELEFAMEQLVNIHAVAPPAHIRSSIIKAISQKVVSHDPPILYSGSTASDYAFWLDRPEMVRPTDAENVFFIPIADNEDGQSAVVWLTDGSPQETHTDCIEKFRVLEGTCEVAFNDHVHKLLVGSVLSVPLHTPHTVKVTSTIPCKILLQRLAA